jgi:hypothetical protein
MKRKFKLAKKLRFFHASGRIHIIYFNQCSTLPLLTKGWTKLRDVYKFRGHKNLFLQYFGRNTFQFHICRGYTSPIYIPRFHSRSTSDGCAPYYDITISKFHVATNYQLVKFLLILLTS